MNSPHVDELIDGYLLGAIEPHEAGLVAAHLDSCSDCVNLLATASEAIAVLPLSLDPMEPRPTLKAQMMAAAQREDAVMREPLPVSQFRHAHSPVIVLTSWP